ncbi:MAG: DUF4363 family protein [Clostridiales bacterium]|jgi:hypothetical protein|nr:DUF4363 family protein [Clostridiales bacterium]
MGKRIFNCIVIVILLALFILPNNFLSALSDELIEKSELSVDAVYREDWENGVALLQEMNALMRLNKDKMYLFLGHQIIENIDTALRSGLQLMQVQDQPQALQELESVITCARYLKTIENFNWSTLF